MGACCGGAKSGGKQKYDKDLKPIARKGPASSTAGGSSPSPAQEVKIFGDYFSSEMRAILTALDYAEVKYNFEHVDKLREENLAHKELKSINPTCQLPTMQHGDTVIIGGYGVMLSYLATTFASFEKINKSND